MSKKERIGIFVDGSNMYHYIRELGLARQLQFDYKKFAEYLARGRAIVGAKYYIGKVRTDGSQKSQELRANQQRLWARLLSFGWEIEYGHMLKSDGTFHEKGVDVQIAVDLLKGAYKDLYDTAVLVSSDNDLIPAIKEVQNSSKQLEYVGFSHRPSFGILKHSSIRTLLKKEDIVQFLPS